MSNVLARSKLVFLLSGVLLLSGVSSSEGFEQEGYATPDTITQQVSPGQLKESYTGFGLLPGGPKVYTTLTTRYRFRGNDYATDHDFYQYLRAHTDQIKLGSGTLRLNAFARFSEDLNGGDKKPGDSAVYYFYRDSLDTQRGHNKGAPRLYMATASFDNVIKNTTLNVGRVNLAHLNTFQLDGGDIRVKLGDALSVYGYGGKPVSYYYETDKDYTFGGGFTFKATKSTTLSAEYTRMHVKDYSNDYTKIRIDQLIPHGSLAVAFTMLDDAGTISGDASYEIPQSGTLLTAHAEGLLKNINDENGYMFNPMTSVLGGESKYGKYSVSAYQPFMKHLAAGISYTGRTVSHEDYQNREYSNIRGKIDIYDLPIKNSYISFTMDYWDIKSTRVSRSNENLQYGVQLSQKINDQIDLWGGTAYNRYEHDTNIELNMDRERTHARSYYIGGQYQPIKQIALMTDLSIEDTDAYDSISKDLNTNYKAEVWASILF